MAWILNLPASTTWSLERLAAPELAGPPGLGVGHVATFDIGASRFNVIAIALYLPVIVALALSRAWRLSWAARGAALVVVFGALALHADQGALRLPLVDIGFLLVPVARPGAVGGGCRPVVTSPVRSAGGAAGVLGTLSWPGALGLLTVADGRWYMPTGTVAQLNGMHAESSVRDTADQRFHFGDSRMLPGAPTDYRDGVALLVTERGTGIEHRWCRRNAVDRSLADALDRLRPDPWRPAAPFGIRYIVVPIFDGAYPRQTPLPIPEGSRSSSLEIRWTAPHYRLFVNRSPRRRPALTGAGVGVTRAGSIVTAAAASRSAGCSPTASGAGEVTPGRRGSLTRTCRRSALRHRCAVGI